MKDQSKKKQVLIEELSDLRQRILNLEQCESRRKQAEEELNANKRQLSNALEMAHLGHWEYYIATDLFTFNDQFYKIFRNAVDQVGGYTMHSAEYAHRFVHPDDSDIVGEEIWNAIETTDPHFNRQIEHRILYADGTVGYITVRFFIVKDSHSRTVKIYGVNQDITERKQTEIERERLITELQSAIEHIKTLRGIIPICANCKKIRDDKGYWEQVEAYVSRHTEAQFSHGICPDCMKILYPEFSDYENTH